MGKYLIYFRLIIKEIRYIFIAIKIFVKIDYILIDSIKGFFSFRRRASKDNFIGFINYIYFVFCGRRAIY